MKKDIKFKFDLNLPAKTFENLREATSKAMLAFKDGGIVEEVVCKNCGYIPCTCTEPPEKETEIISPERVPRKFNFDD